MHDNRFFVCEKCGNLIGMLHDAGIPMMCCGQKMTHLDAKTDDEGKEKHIPDVTFVADTVKVDVGRVSHPMEDEHNISWVYLETDRGGQRKCLKIGSKPTVNFALTDEKPVSVYAYCNKHGLWKTDI